jgi:hypothetical protein
VDVQEIKKLDAYLKRLFGNARIRVTPKTNDLADVFIGEERLGEMNVDDEDEDKSYNFRMEFKLGVVDDLTPKQQLDAYLKRKFDNEQIRAVVRAKKQDSLEVYVGEEFIGVVFIENEKTQRTYILEMPILEMDLT